MTIEIPQEKWTEFFDDLSRRRYGWTAKIEVLEKSAGDQILSEGLPLNGIIFEEKAGRRNLEISVGENAERHQSHTIQNPSKVIYLENEKFPGGVLEIEDADGTQTLVGLVSAMPVYVGYASSQIVAANL